MWRASLTGAVLVAAAVAVAAVPAASADGGLVEHLANGTVRITTPEGVTVVGTEGIKVEVQTSSSDTGGIGSVKVIHPDDSDVEALAAEYAKAGRSPVQDALAAGVSPVLVAKMKGAAASFGLGGGGVTPSYTYGGAVIYSSFCVEDTEGNVEWDGCVVRAYDSVDADPTYRYYIDETQGTGFETSDWPWQGLLAGGVRNEYNTTNVTILQISPGSDVTVGSCSTQGFGFNIAGFGVSSTGTVCPDRWDTTRDYSSVPRYHKVEWQGDTHDDREAMALTGFKGRDGYSTAYTLRINWAWG